ncbi:MAG: MarR family transcriptional regulator [Blautia marasmi]
MDYLREHDGSNQKAIAAACHIEPASLTSVLGGMEQKGLIERKSLNGNRRSFTYSSPKRGRKWCSMWRRNFPN